MDISKINTPEGQLKHRVDMASGLVSTNISHDQLGTSGFQEAEDLKKSICKYLIDILLRADQQRESLSRAELDKAIEIISKTLNDVSTQVEAIESLVEAGVHNEQFPQKREGYTASLRKIRDRVTQQLHSFEVDLQLSEIREIVNGQNYLAEARDEVEQCVVSAQQAAAQVDAVLLNLQSKATGQAVSESKSHFSELKAAHRCFEWTWFVAFFAFVVGAAATIAWIVNAAPPEELDIQYGIKMIQKGVLLSGLGVAIKLCLTKYNTERKLRILYEHREKVLDLYRSFEAGIAEDNHDAKNAFRLEIARYVFSDPRSQYDDGNAGDTQVHLNPIMGVIEGVTKKPG